MLNKKKKKKKKKTMVTLVDAAKHTNAHNLGLCKKYDNFYLKNVTAVKAMCILQSGVNV